MALYCTAADLVNYADEGLIRSQVTDTGQSLTGDLAASPVIVEFIAAASGRLEAACLISKNYTVADLQAMSDNSKALARSITAQLVVASVLSRRVNPAQIDNIRAMREEAEDYLQHLRNGARLFDVDDHAEAGLPEAKFPTAQQIVDLNQITMRTRNFYPNPTARLPISRGGG